MSPVFLIAVLAFAFLLSAFITALVIRYALRRSLLDIPNERSSHTTPTPRGGGLAIAVTFLGTVTLSGVLGYVSADIALALTGGGALIAVIGWLDDHGHIAPLWRALVHFVAAGWALFWLGGMPELRLGVWSLPLGWFGHLLAAVGIVWLINLYNFMDGVDGLAGGEAVTIAMGGAILLGLAGALDLALVALLLAAASGGFLIFNWPPAKIFMGDVGSGLLGYVFAVLALASERVGAVPAVVWGILLAVFISDATYTLIYRMFKGEQWYAAHRSHAYQRLVQMGWSHLRVTRIILYINIMILFAIATVALVWPAQAPWCVAMVGIVTWVVWLRIQRNYSVTTNRGSKINHEGNWS